MYNILQERRENMGTRWYEAYTATPELLLLFIKAAGLDDKIIDINRLKELGQNGFRSVEKLLEEVILADDEAIQSLLKKFRDDGIEIDKAAFAQAWYKYREFIYQPNVLIDNLNELLIKICSMQTTDLTEALAKMTYLNVVKTLLSQVMRLKVVDKKSNNQLLEFDRMSTIIYGLTNMLLTISLDDASFLLACSQKMDEANPQTPKNTLDELIKKYGNKGIFLYLIIAAGSTTEIEVDKMFVPDETTLDRNGLSALAREVAHTYFSKRKVKEYNPIEFILKRTIATAADDYSRAYKKSVGNHGQIPARTSYFQALYHHYARRRDCH